MTFLDPIPFDRLLWLVPVFLTIHNIEEAPLMENWYKHLPMKIPLTITTRQFVIAVTFITIAGFVVTYFGVQYLANQTGYLLVLAMQAILLFQCICPAHCYDNSIPNVWPGRNYCNFDHAPLLLLLIPPRVRGKHN